MVAKLPSSVSREEQILDRLIKFTHSIHQLLPLEEILGIAVKEIQELLQTDRTLIYRCLSDGTAIVEAEAVNPGFSAFLGQSIQIFNREKQSEGFKPEQITVIEDLTTIKLQNACGCQAEPVRSLLEAPIFVQGKEWGGLMVHACQCPRTWLSWELQLLKQIALQIGIAIQYSDLHFKREFPAPFHNIPGQIPELGQPNRETLHPVDGVIWELGERKAAETLLQKYKRIISATPSCTSLVDRNYIYQIVNDTYLVWNQKSYEEIVGHSVADLLGQDFFETVCKPHLDRCLAGETEHTFNTWQNYGDGQRRFVKATYSPYREPDGSISGVVINVHDVTDLKCAEEALSISEEQRRLALDLTQMGSWDGSFLTGELTWSQQMYALFGYALGDPNYVAWRERVLPEDLKVLEAAIAHSQEERTYFNCEYRILHPDGTIRWLLGRGHTLYNESDQPTRMVGVVMDISERKELEIALQKSEERYRQIVETATEGIWIIDANNSTTFVNPRMAEMLGYSHDEMLGKTLFDFMDEEGIAIATRLIERRRQGIVEQHDFKFRHKDGSEVWAIVSTRPFLDSSGHYLGALGMLADITQRKADEAILQRLNQELEQRVQERTQALYIQAEQERVLRLVAERIHKSFNLDDVLGTALEVTRQTLKADRVAVYRFNPDWSGYFAAEAVSANWVPLVGTDAQKVWADTHLQDTKGGRYQNGEIFAVDDIYTIGHSQCHIDLLEQFQAKAYAIVPVFVHNALWGLLAAYQNSAPRSWQPEELDLLQQIAVQTAIAIQQSDLYQTAQSQVEELERLNQVKDDFLSTVSHELRSPMTNIKMATQMLEIQLSRSGMLQTESNSAVDRYLKVLKEQCEREIQLINDLLDLARLDSSNVSLSPTRICLALWVEQLTGAFVERTKQQQQQLRILIPNDLELETDVSYLERIIAELLHNACKYTPAGETIQISASRIEGSSTNALKSFPSPPSIQICVSNSGVEIPPDECQRIFEKFYRIPGNDHRKQGGTGLGLALVKKLTEHLGGSIHIESRCKQTSFILDFAPSCLDTASH
jgi:PAS domain S-box-containing protein